VEIVGTPPLDFLLEPNAPPLINEYTAAANENKVTKNAKYKNAVEA
jgi:hypothetical protein